MNIQTQSSKIAVGIIPARYSSTRFPGKALAKILDKPLIQHTYEKTKKAKLLQKVIVATDNKKIFQTVKKFGGEVIMTSTTHNSGTDRIAEVVSQLNINSNLIVNIQGDEPLIEPNLIDNAIKIFSKIQNFKMGSLMTRIKQLEDILNPNIVKVVVNKDSYALYFSRQPIAFRENFFISLPVYQHIGFYVFEKNFLLQFSKMPQTPLELAEKLEQLRALENGIKIKMLKTSYRGLGVDIPEDIPKLIKLMKG